MRILIVGSGGRLGAALAEAYKSSDNITALDRNALDLSNFSFTNERLKKLNFDVLINCAALTNVDFCESHQEQAYQINGRAVGILAEICRNRDARLVHISTDYVFDGQKEGAYTEADPAHPISVYGASKKKGEEEALSISGDNLVVRVSWVFGPHRPSFIDGILRRALDYSGVEAIADKYSTPTYTRDIAELLRPLLDNGAVRGILHLCNAGKCTWQEYGQHAIDCALGAGATLKARTVNPIPLAEMKSFVAKRPVNSVLSTARLASFGSEPRDWKSAVQEYVERAVKSNQFQRR